MTAPKWAQDLTLNALAWYEQNNPGCKAPDITLNWRRSSYHKNSSGRANGVTNRVTVTAGKIRLDQKLVLLHEVAHVLVPGGHTDAFWDMTWALYRWAQLPIRYCQKREYTYKAGARAAYARSK